MTETGVKLTSGAMLRGAIALVREHPGAVLIWLLVSMLAEAGSALALRPLLRGLLLADNPGSGIGPALGKTLGFAFANGVVMIVLFAASQRIVLRPQERGFAALRLGWDELRLLGICVLLLIVFVLVCIAAIVLIGALAGILAVFVHSRESASALGFVLALPLILLAVWAQVRLSLSLPLTMMRRRAVIDEAWQLGQGRFWTLFGAYFAIGLALWLARILIGLLTGESYFIELLRSGFDFEQARLVADIQFIHSILSDVDAIMILSWVLGGVVGGLSVALSGGAAVAAALALDGEDDIAAS